MNLKLKRPLAFFDLETTGVNVSADRIVEISILKVSPDGSEAVKTLKINPEMPIPIESSVIHGIYDKDVEGAPTFKAVAPEIAEFIGDADLAGYNSNKFDIPMLMEEFLRAGVDFSLTDRFFVDVQNIFHQMEQRTLKAAYRFYCDKDLENAHSAEDDVRATYDVLRSQLDRYRDTEWEDKAGNKSVPVVNDVEALHRFTNLNRPVDFAGRMVFNEQGEEVFNFGKHKGRTVESVFDKEPSYYAWMMQGDFPLYTKQCLERIWQRFRAKQKEQRAQSPAKAEKTGSQQANTPQRNPGKPQREDRPKKKAGPITDDMLKGLQAKFGK
ncbi:3'-5' exonuclease [Parapedobacter soli]|uniref:3'-5' exonuclease n=1 Tax=Parapedobacter soli TaxID=416955 RepID=UPI0021C8C604|nr:3'-5' exonuclease [Parapedobacter soli]